MSDFVLRAENEGRWEIEDLRKVKYQDYVSLYTQAGLLIVRCLYSNPVLFDENGKLVHSMVTYPNHMEIDVAELCCPGIYPVQAFTRRRCQNCEKRFKIVDSFSALKPASTSITPWLSEDEFIERASSALSQKDTFNAVLWAQDLYRFLKTHYDTRMMGDLNG